ncbi:MAG: DUF4340 domain-containing protein [Pirellulales bacterium]|nr:DUF4340 domain-containing protein [Pirellulales bacterium]
MKENQKTALLIVVALALGGVAWASRPKPVDMATIEKTRLDQPLFPDFKDPQAARSMEIIDYDADKGAAKTFKVAQVQGVWVLPSHYNYPADAEQQLGQAAASLMDLKIRRIAGDKASQFSEFGVVDPATAEPGAKGVGKHVVLADANGKKLLDLIIGLEIKGQAKQRFVRKGGKDEAIYVVDVATDKLSTKFEDWIEKNLLKLNAFDIQRVQLNNYSIDLAANDQFKQGERLDLKFNDKDNKWSLAELAAGEELDDTKLNEMKNALADLRIVDVRRKPAGLSRELRKSEGIALDEQAIRSLGIRGFYLTPDGELLSNQGEAVVSAKDGVQYVLRFGELAFDTDPNTGQEQVPAADAEGKVQAPKSGNNRYIFVTAQFNPDLVPAPELQAIPGEEAPAAPPADGAQPAADGQPAPGDTPPLGPEAGDKPAAPEGAAAPDNEASEPAGPGGDDEAPAADAAAKAQEPAAPADAPPPAPPQPDEAKPADAQPAAAPPAEDPAVAAIRADNKRKQNEYEEKIKKGEERVKELNDRFADWYYVISNDVYRKIHLNRIDMLKKPNAEQQAEGQDTPGEFEKLKQNLGAPAPAPVPAP